MREAESSDLNFINLLSEFRAVGEFARFAGHAWTWRLGGRAANPRSILLIPGFLAGDATLYPFANWLRSRGHQVYFSGILANTECPKRAMDRLAGMLTGHSRRAGEKLVVIGHSLGGIYARELARRLPEFVEQVILLASPIHNPLKHANPYVKMLAVVTRRMNDGNHGCCDGELATVCGVNLPEPPADISETLIYSKSDGVVDWTACVEEGPKVTAFRVDSTHCGLPYNLETLRIVRTRIEGQ
ncbi:MAG TPA: alpha/beta hydrolase [Candidatus Binataceae bacterium]|nr:alpha/beta hydrolase [Candidatus Binataceae bacterium]